MRSAHLQLLQAVDLPVHAFQRRREHLFAPQGMLDRTRKALSSRRPFPACFALFRAREGALLATHVPQTATQPFEFIEHAVVNSGMMAAQDDLMLLMAEDAALKFAGYGHGAYSNYSSDFLISAKCRRGKGKAGRMDDGGLAPCCLMNLNARHKRRRTA